MAKKNNKTEDQFAQVEGALTKTEQFFEDNQKKIARVFSIVIGVVALFSWLPKLLFRTFRERSSNRNV